MNTDFLYEFKGSISKSLKSDKDDAAKILKELINVNTLKDLYTRMEGVFNSDPNIEREIQLQLGSVISNLYHVALNNSDGYCFKFSLPIVSIQSIFKKIKIPADRAEEIFRHDWQYPKNTRMYSDKDRN